MKHSVRQLWPRHAFLLLCLALPHGVQAKDTCVTVWGSLVRRLGAGSSGMHAEDLYQLRISNAPASAFEKLRAASDEQLEKYAGGYLGSLFRGNSSLDRAAIFEKARQLPFDSESLTHQELDFWHLRFRHFWGGGLQHPRDLERFAVLEMRARFLDDVTGNHRLRQARQNALFEESARKLNTGDLRERLDAVGHLAELGDQRSTNLLQKASREDPKLAVRTSARLALLALGRRVVYDAETLKDMRRSPFRQGNEDHSIAHEELARLPDEALETFFENSYLKILESDLSMELFANRSRGFIEKHMGHPDPWIRGLAVRGLRNRQEADLLPLLEKALHDESVFVRHQAVEALATRRDPGSLGLLGDAARSHPDLYIQSLAERLVPAESPKPWISNDVLISQLRGNDKAAAIRAAEELPYRPLNVISLGLRSPHAEVRLKAVEALRERKDAGAVHLALLAFDPVREPVMDIRLAALEILFRARTREADEAIHHALQDGQARIRERAFALAKEDTVLRFLATRPLHEAHQITRIAREHLSRFDEGLVRADHIASRQAAEHVYEVPEPGEVGSGAELVAQQKRFLAGIPRGQEVVMAGSDPETGFKFYYSMPRAGFEDQPRMFAVAGTEGIMDVYADMNLGFPQVQSRFFQEAKARLLKDLEAGHDIDITGHSLGGLSAGVMAYELQLARKSMKNPGKVRLITWNGLGAGDVLAWRGNFSPEVARELDATNYHVPGDIVWRLGTRIGRDVALPGTGTFRPVSAHVMRAISRLTEGSGLKEAKDLEGAGRSHLAPLLARYFGWVGTWLQKARYRRSEMRILRNILEARIEWAREEGYQHLNPEFTPWSGELGLIQNNLASRKHDRAVSLIHAYESLRQSVLDAKRKLSPRSEPPRWSTELVPREPRATDG